MESLVVVVLGIHVLYDIKSNPYINVSSSTMPKMIKSKKHNLYNRIKDRRGGKYTELNESFTVMIDEKKTDRVYFEVKIGHMFFDWPYVFFPDIEIGKGKTIQNQSCMIVLFSLLFLFYFEFNNIPTLLIVRFFSLFGYQRWSSRM